MSTELERAGDLDRTVVDRGRAQALRGPRMVPFLLTGALLGVILAGVLHFFGPQPDEGGTVQELILISVLFAGIGGLLGGMAFLAVERFTRR